jgi:hypothetical protein
VKVDACEKEKKSKEKKKTKKDSEKIKLFAPCQYEEIKPGIRDHDSGFGTKTKEVQGKKKKEDVKSRRGKSETKQMKGGVSVGGSYPKIKNPCPDLLQKKEEEDWGVSSKLVEDVPVDQLIDGIVTLNNLREVSDEITVPDIKLITTLKYSQSCDRN